MADPTSITQTLPAPFIEAGGKNYLAQLETAIGGLGNLDVSQLYGPQFVAGASPLQQQAQALASGLGSYQPYLQQAGQMGTQAAQTLAGAQQYAGPQAYQQFMSPYQQDVINTALQQYDIQAQKGLSPLSAQAVGSGAFGGAREGIQRAQYQSASDLNRAQLQANLLNQGFGQAQTAAQNAYQQQLSAAQAQQGLGAFQGALGQSAQQLAGNQIQGLQQLGQQQQQIEQARLSAQQQALQSQAFEPYTRYGLVGQQLTGLAGGFPGQVQTYNPIQPVSPLQSFLGTATGLGGLAGKIFG